MSRLSAAVCRPPIGLHQGEHVLQSGLNVGFAFATTGNPMDTKLITIENRSGPFRPIFQRVMRMVPDRDKNDKRLQRMLAFRLINDGEAETTAYLVRNIRHFIRRPDPISFFDFLRDGRNKDFLPTRSPNGGPPGAA